MSKCCKNKFSKNFGDFAHHTFFGDEMRFSRSSVAVGITALTMSLLVNGPARAVDSAITVGDNVCDYAAAGLGHGSASDPFIINSAKSLQEMSDCSNRNASNNRSTAISAVTVNANGTVSFTVANTHGAFGVGQVVDISGTDGGTFDAQDVTVISATSTVVVVKSAVTSGTTAAGTISSNYDYFKLGADINLATAQNDVWNDLRSATITAAESASGVVTYTAANTFTAGQAVFINGMGDKEFNLGHVSVGSVTSTSFTVTGTSVADGAASAAGGKADAPGWAPLANLQKFDLNGAGKTISGLTIHDSNSNRGLIGYAKYANIHNLNLTNVNVDATSNDSGSVSEYVGALVARTGDSNTSNINVSGKVIGSYRYVGMAIGRSDRGNDQYITTSGTVSGGRINVGSNSDGESSPSGYWDDKGGFAGVIGFSRDGSLAHLTSSVDVNGFVESQDGDSNIVYLHNVGGAVGLINEASVRYINTTGDVIGGSSVGGAIGIMGYDGEMSHGSATGSVTGVTNNGWNLLHVGGFGGSLMGQADVSYVTSSGAVSATATSESTGSIQQVGGLGGEIYCCGVTNSVSTSSDVTVTQNGTSGVYKVGGLYGDDDCCNVITDAHATGDVTINVTGAGNVEYVGGLVGSYDCCGTFRDSDATGNVNVTMKLVSGGVASRIGGFLGYSSCCQVITGSFSTGNVTVNNGYNVGGFIGEVDCCMAIRDSYATGNVTVSYDGNANTGGFLGYANGNAERITLERVSATGNVTVSPFTSGQSAKRVGGLVGYLDDDEGAAIINDSYYKGSVTASDEVAGFIGGKHPDRQLSGKRNYVAATVTATATSPLLVDPVAIGNWVDGNRSSFVNSTLANTSVNFPRFNAATTSNMKLAATFEAKGWVFSGNDSGWRISSSKNGGYPYLVVPANDDSSIARGAVAKAATPASKKTAISTTVAKFPAGSSTMSQTGKTAIKKIVSKSGKDATYTITGVAGKIAGVTDAKVKALAKARAEKVKTYLIKLGVKKSKISIKIKILSPGITPKTKILAKYLTN
jgi:outer membrane protein OmpA-like peptidoglycan-associated protein